MRQIEIPINNNPLATSRSLNPEHTTNSHLSSADEKLIEEMRKAIKELYIRFDTLPSYYLKEDYKKLIDTLSSGFEHLYLTKTPEVATEWHTPVSNERVPSEKLTKETIDAEASTRSQADTTLQLNLNTEISNRQAAILNLMPLIYAGL